ncbi:MAG: penicillin-binding protein 1C [Pseudotabrizicola sp.]|uniref:penicillin-binding protein 1C n=1 Tax=Pseudotabrizicola sp. TaxID=2939647 RepID=UPI002731F7DB|nr:penicillin-binding protein 1C [Pseudotabrizicola sp.]MDP2082122.1 penicillin-binding protein 1C [Pseudotabrizicola sp.]MDZ7576515.1 penicillin-binding protein 1C [Pseudotabrizicola sp.]
MMRASIAFSLAASLFLTGLARDRFDDWITATHLPPLALETSVEVTDRDGTLLRAYTVADGRWRMAVDLGDVDEDYRAMLIAYEDKRFYDHAGVDLRAMSRAVAQALRNGRVISGGSTLTMQVARLLEDSGTGAMAGKFRQMRVAWALERQLTKDQILQLYMHLAPFGGNLEGVRAASFAYFGKEPRRLTPAQAALLVAIPQAPESRRPDRAHARSVAARERVLARALRDSIVPDHMAQGALTEPVPNARQPFPALAPHLADRARSDDPIAARHQLTLKASLQRSLEFLARDVIATQGERLQIAIVAADHKSGEILASVGSAAFQADARAGFVDMTTALRSPGSTLKPLIYGLAFDQGLAHPETMMEDRPQRFGTYAPQNFDRQFRGTIRVRDALQLSLNLPVVQLLDAMGPPRLLAAFDKAAIRAVIPGGQPGLAIGLGGIGISLTDMVQLYAAIARGGVALPLTWRMDGTRAEGQRLLSTGSAWQVGDILAGLAPPPGAPSNRLAYKTGTSYGHRDAWAIGYDGRHVVGVWLGRADGTPVPGVFGADLAAPVLFQAFTRIAPQLAPQPPAPPATLLVSNTQLPQPLQRFRPRDTLTGDTTAPSVAFPPDGAEVELLNGILMVKVAGGTGPFTWLADGVPVVVQDRARQAMLTLPGTGFVSLSVIDAQGRSARAKVRLH